MDEPLICPDCGQKVRREAGTGGVRYACPGCHGFAAGLAVARQTLREGLAPALWMASADVPADGAACPLCANPMRVVPTPEVTDRPGVPVCRTCELIWVPGSDAPGLAAPAPATAQPATVERAMPDRCPNCGAPSEPGPDGCCRFCHEAFVAPQVVLISGRGPDDTSGSGGDLGAMAGQVVRHLFGLPTRDG